MDFFQMTGKMALGSRLRKLSDMMTENAANIYSLYGIELEPRWFPVFYMLSENDVMSVTEIALVIGQSHASVSQILKQMRKKGLLTEVKDEADGRKSLVALSEKGREILPRIADQYADVRNAMEELTAQMQYDIWKAMDEMEYLLQQKSLFDRVKSKRKERESQKVHIIPYTPAYQKVFKDLNIAWIEAYFDVEEKDLLLLDHPQSYILDNGGYILLAKYEEEVVGTCAMLKLDQHRYELAKMAVAPKAQGKNIGRLLGETAIAKARNLGAHSIYIESNTRLVPALRLYESLGFKKVTGPPSPYAKANIQLELILD